MANPMNEMAGQRALPVTKFLIDELINCRKRLEIYIDIYRYVILYL